MALPLVIANCVQVRLLWSINANGAVNVLHGSVSAGFVANQAVTNTLASAIKSAFTANLGGACGTTTILVRVGLRDLRQPNLPEFLDTGAVIAGTATGDPLPGHVAACITLRTAQSGKSFRGRVYLSGFTEGSNDTSGATAGSTTTACTNFIAAIQSAMTASQITMGVASRPGERYTIVKTTFHQDGSSTAETVGRGNARSGGIVPVTLVQARTNGWETQRRRVNGRGGVPSLLGGVATIDLSEGSSREPTGSAVEAARAAPAGSAKTPKA